MADIAIIPNTPLQFSPQSCNSCISLDEIGQKTSTNGNFLAHFESSLKQLIGPDDGEQLPAGGNILPQMLLSSFDQANQFELPSLVNNISEHEISAYSLNEQVANLFDFEEVQEKLENLPAVITSGINSLNALQDSISTQLHTEDELTVRLDPLLRVTGQASPAKLTQSSPNISTTYTQQTIFPHALYEQSGFEKSEVHVPENSVRDILDTKINQQASINDSDSESIDNLVRKSSLEHFIDGSSSIKLLNQKQPIEAELFQQTFSASKSDAVLQYAHQVSANDTAQRLNIGAITDYTIDAPIPLNLKQSSLASLEHTTQGADQSLFQNIKWLIGNKIQNANINVYPESLGHVNVALNLEESKLTINFLVSSPVTKEVIEGNLSSLRDNLNESGVNIQEVNVNSRFSDDTERDSQFSGNENKGSSNQFSELSSSSDENEAIHLNKQNEVHASLYLIDAYA